MVIEVKNRLEVVETESQRINGTIHDTRDHVQGHVIEVIESAEEDPIQDLDRNQEEDRILVAAHALVLAHVQIHGIVRIVEVDVLVQEHDRNLVHVAKIDQSVQENIHVVLTVVVGQDEVEKIARKFPILLQIGRISAMIEYNRCPLFL